MFLANILLVIFFYSTYGCPPQPDGNCYGGQWSGSVASIGNERCTNDPLRDWCAVTYMPSTSIANFGCAGRLSPPLGAPSCGSLGGIQNNGCNMVNTASGPCYLCCCKGGSCNHPQVFQQQAAASLGSMPDVEWTWTGDSTKITYFLLPPMLIIMFVV